MVECSCYPEYKDGNRFNEWIAFHFGECAYSSREIASFIIGMMSLVFWIACSAPQFYSNYQRKSAGALSKWFLLEWFLGDALNLTGALLTHQLPTQIATGVLFVFNDTLLISQVFYYTYYGQDDQDDSEQGSAYEPLLTGNTDDSERGNLDEDQVVREENGSGSTNSVIFASVIAPIAISMVQFSKFGGHYNVLDAVQTNSIHDLPSCDASVTPSPDAERLGMIIGWVSGAVYLNSRIPQILKNQRRRSVEGLSVTMFGCAVMGNTTYGLGVLLKDSSWGAIQKALPWLVGSLGTLLLDFTILAQFWKFSEDEQDDEEDDSSESGILFGTQGFRHGAAGGSARKKSRNNTQGLYGIKAWNTSPFFRPMARRTLQSENNNMPTLSLGDSVSLGVLPDGENQGSASVSSSRDRSESH